MASTNSQLDQYRKSSITGASPLRLVIMLYDGALRFMAAGRRAMTEKNLYEQNRNIQRAQRIIAELMSCLDMRQGGEVATNLLALYTFSYNRLVESNVSDDPRGIDEVSQVLSNLREGWVELEASLRQGLATDAA